MGASERTFSLSAVVLGTLHHPVRLRVALAAALLTLWYTALYRPLTGRIVEGSRRLTEERERLELARAIDQLAHEEGRYKRRLPEDVGRNAWVQFLMDGIRQRSLKLISLDPLPTVDVGPYRAEVSRVVVEGSFPELEGFLRWLETSPRLVRIDLIDLGPRQVKSGGRPEAPDGYRMQLIVLGVTG